VTNICSFSTEGIEIVRAQIDSHASNLSKGSHGARIDDSELAEIAQLAENDDLLEDSPYEIEIDTSQKFASSYDLGAYLCKQFGSVDISPGKIGIWTWLSIAYLSQLLNQTKDGRFLLGRSYRYVFEADNRLRYYRHLVFMPTYLVHRLGEHAYVFLYSPPYVSGEFLAQAQKDDVISNANLVAMCEQYFFDRKSGKFVPGFTGKSSDPRSLRRLVEAIVPQLSVNYDTRFCGPDEIFSLLPLDFQEYAIKKGTT